MNPLMVSIRRLGGAGAVINARYELLVAEAGVVAARAVVDRVQSIDHDRSAAMLPTGSAPRDGIRRTAGRKTPRAA